MRKNREPFTILIADDDDDDCMLIKEAFAANRFTHDLRFVEDGEELVQYLYRRRRYEDARLSPRPHLILLDLNMPKKNGHEALQEIKVDPVLRRIPVVAFATSEEEEEILLSYDLGVSSFIVKPMTFDEWVEIARCLNEYWFKIVVLPPRM